MKMKNNFTNEQNLAITLKNKNIIISAGAGSGKTRVLTNRVCELLLNENVTIDKFLIITFTRLATFEMKQRIIDTLKDNLDLKENDKNKKHILEQNIKLIQTADIRTIDSFFQKLVKKYSNILEITNDFKIIDEIDNNELIEESLDELLELFYSDADITFINFLEQNSINFGDESIRKMILDIYNIINGKDLDFINEILSIYDINSLKIDTITPILEDIQYKIYLINYIYNETINDLPDKTAKDIELKDSLNDINNLFLQLNDAINILEDNELVINAINIIKNYILEIKNIQKNLPRKKSLYKDYIKEEIEKIEEYFIYNNLEENFNEILEQDFINSKETLMLLIKLSQKFKEIYDEKKKKIKSFTYTDIELYAKKLLENDDIVSELKKEYTYVFVDEYQDVNYNQNFIINRLKNNNLFLVGDKKQSIYGFRGSNSDIITNLYNLSTYYKDNKDALDIKIDLNINFRSNKNIIDYVNSLFRMLFTYPFYTNNYKDNILISKDDYFYNKSEDILNEENEVADRFFLKNNLKFNYNNFYKKILKNKLYKFNKINLKKTIIKIEINKKAGLYLIKNKEEKIFAIKNLITEINSIKINKYNNGFYQKIKKYKINKLKLKENEITILVRKNKYINYLKEELDKLNIKINANINNFLYKKPEIKIIIDYLQIINNPRRDINLISILCSKFYMIDIEEIALIRKLYIGNTLFESLLKYIKNWNENLEIEKTLTSEEIFQIKKILTTNTFNKISKFLDNFYDFNIKSNILKLSDFINYLLNEIKYIQILSLYTYEYVEYDEEEYEKLFSERINNKNTFIKKAINFENRKNNSLEYFVKYLSKSDNVEDKQVENEKYKINIMTIHKSKGLEFDYVILADIDEPLFKTNTNNILHYDKYISMPFYLKKDTNDNNLMNLENNIIYKQNSFMKKIINKYIKNFEVKEEIRNLYVAITRAKKQLYMIAVSDKNDSIKIKKSDKSIEEFILNYNNFENKDLIYRNRIFNIKTYLDLILFAFDERYIKIVKRNYKNIEINNTISSNNINIIEPLEILKLCENNIFIDKSKLENTRNNLNNLLTTKINTNFIYNIDEKTNNKINLNLNKNKIDYALIGNIYHKLLEKHNFNENSIENLKLELNTILINNNLQHYYKYIDLEKIQNFLDSNLGKRIQKAYLNNNLFREISYLYYENNKYTKGIIDLYFIENNNIILVDYKTDRMYNTDFENIKEKYIHQLNRYKNVLEHKYNKPVFESYIYSIEHNKSILID